MKRRHVPVSSKRGNPFGLSPFSNSLQLYIHLFDSNCRSFYYISCLFQNYGFSENPLFSFCSDFPPKTVVPQAVPPAPPQTVYLHLNQVYLHSWWWGVKRHSSYLVLTSIGRPSWSSEILRRRDNTGKVLLVAFEKYLGLSGRQIFLNHSKLTLSWIRTKTFFLCKPCGFIRLCCSLRKIFKWLVRMQL